jgi:hypothetical protein
MRWSGAWRAAVRDALSRDALHSLAFHAPATPWAAPRASRHSMLDGVHPEERSHLAAMLRAVCDAPPNTLPALAHLRALRHAPLSADENLAWVWAEIKLSSDGARLAGTAKISRQATRP